VNHVIVYKLVMGLPNLSLLFCFAAYIFFILKNVVLCLRLSEEEILGVV